jgi:hypothetical protein
MIGHDRFEILAGAVMLGEANDAERAAFDAHVSACESCRLDAACAPVVLRSVEAAKAAETWRPSVGSAVVGRIRESRTSRFGKTVGVLGWAVALSIVLNVAFVSGLSTHIHDAFAPEPDDAPYVSAMKIDLESPAPLPAPVRRAAWHPHAVAFVARPKPHALVARPAAVPVAPDIPTAAAGVTIPPSAADAVPDVLAGIDVDGSETDGAKHVAVQPHCAGAPDPVATDAAPAPCASAQELQH